MKYVLLLAVLGCGGDGKSRGGDSVKAEASRPDAPASTQDARRTRPNAARRTILFAGTSLTAGLGLEPDSAYPQQIQRMIDGAGLRYEVVNAGVSGETSSSLLRRLDWLLRQPLDIVVIETGANDGLRGVPVTTMKANIQQIIERIRAARPDARIVLVQMESPPNLGRAYTQQFRDVFPELARKNDVTLLPFLLEGVAGVRALNQADGMHPNEDGERIVARNVWRALAPMLAQP